MSFFSKILSFKKNFETPFDTLNNIYISKANILSNYDLFKKLHPNWSIFPVLKSNAYGHWIKEIASILKSRKTDFIVVDSYFEALKVREVNPSNILLIGFTLPSNFKNMDFSFLSLTVYDMDSLRALSKLKRSVKIHLKIDTWMRRQGIYMTDLPMYLDFIKENKNLELEWVCMHFSDADSIDSDCSLAQEMEFKKTVDMIKMSGFKLKYIHADNSAAWAKSLGRSFVNAMRLGVSLYWVNPLSKEDSSYSKLEWLKLPLRFESTLVLKKKITKWDKVSYNWTFEAKNDMEIWIVPVWYYEWISRKLSSNYSYYFNDKPLNILWRVCMNLTVVDISWVDISVWDKIEVIWDSISKDNNIYNMALRSETIPYECFTRLSETIRRNIK